MKLSVLLFLVGIVLIIFSTVRTFLRQKFRGKSASREIRMSSVIPPRSGDPVESSGRVKWSIDDSPGKNHRRPEPPAE